MYNSVYYFLETYDKLPPKQTREKKELLRNKVSALMYGDVVTKSEP